MLVKELLLKRFEHNHWVNMRLLDHATRVTPEQWDDPSITYSNGNLHNTLHHIIRVQHSWLIFCEDDTSTAKPPTIDSFPTAQLLQKYCEEVHTATYAFLEGLDEAGLGAIRVAQSSDGTWRQERIVWQCLMDILYHSAQHQSEVAELLTRYGQSPGEIDFMDFVEKY